MGWELGEKEKVKDGTHSRDDLLWRYLCIGNWEVHNEPKEEMTHVLVFLACDAREPGYALAEYGDVVIWWYRSTPRVNFRSPKGINKPSHQMLEHALQ